jgi:recombination protein RecR
VSRKKRVYLLIMSSFQKLTELFRQFPGIGPRQAKRFAYFLLTRNNGYLEELAEHITSIKQETATCSTCFRFFAKEKNPNPLCSICRDKNRDAKLLMIVSRDIDIEAVEKSGVYSGLYFVLGGTVPILEEKPEEKIRAKELQKSVAHKANEGLGEIILGLNLNPEGENTAEYLIGLLSPLTEKSHIKISHLGRGISTGTELEYADSDTLKNALKNRS